MTAHNEMSMPWRRLAATIASSIFIMFLLMYQLVYELDHVMFSINRFVASLVMGAVMTALMLVSMWQMYKGLRTKLVVLFAALALGTALLAMNRSQTLVGDTDFMRAMVPHHSIAINNARRARISDPRVRRLADQIIAGQVREIAEMKLLIQDIERNGRRGDVALPARPAEVTPEMLAKIHEAVE